MSITRPNIVQQENRLKSLPDEALRTMLLQMGQSGQVGSPQYLLAAGEMQARKNVRQQAAMGKPQQAPVIAELLTGIDMPQRGGQQDLPEDTGIAMLSAPNMENLDQPEYAGGGIVAFSPGGSTGGRFTPPTSTAFMDDELRALEMMDPTERKEYYRQKFQARESALKSGAPARAPSAPMGRAPGFFGLAGRAITGSLPAVSMGWDSLFGTPDAEVDKLKAFDAAKATLKEAGFTDKDISRMSTEDVYRMASGYQPQSRSGTSVADTAGGPAYRDFKDTDTSVDLGNAPSARGQGGAPGGTPGTGGTSTSGLFGQVKSFMDQFYPASTETLPTEAQAVKSRMDALKAAGVEMDPYKDLREKVERGMAQTERDKEKAGWEALGVFGLTLASTPGDFLSALGKAGLPALKQYTGDIKDLKKLAREDDRLLAQLKANDNELKLKVTQSGLDERQKIIDRIQNERGKAATVAASVFGGLATLESAKETRAETRKDTLLRSAREQARRQVEAKVRATPGLAMDPKFDYEGAIDALEAQILQQWGLTGGAAPRAAATPRGRVVNGVYVPAGQ